MSIKILIILAIPNFMSNIPSNIKFLRKKKGLTQQQFADQIFSIFQRLHRKTDYSGTGIGLAICKKIAQNHQGTIYATSEPGQGSVFHILLPVHHLQNS